MRVPLLLLLGTLVIALLQLIPLPPVAWQSLPGRDLLYDTLRAADLPTDTFRPLTFDRVATIEAALHLLPVTAMFIATCRLGEKWRRLMLAVIVATALASMATYYVPLGQMVDLLAGKPMRSAATYEGFFANRNHQATFMLVAAVSLAALVASAHRHSSEILSLGSLLACILILGALTTRSRMGLALVVPVLVGCSAMIWQRWRSNRLQPRHGLLLLAGMVLLLVWAAGFFLIPVIFERVEISGTDEIRLQKWPDVVWAIMHFFPAGSGLGTFDTIFRTVEGINDLNFIYMNQAHNEYLQILMETGILGWLMLAVAITWFVTASFGAWSNRNTLATAGSVVLLVYLLHSVVDYPLRTISHAALLGFFSALLASPAHERIRQRGSKSGRRATRSGRRRSKSSSQTSMDSPA